MLLILKFKINIMDKILFPSNQFLWSEIDNINFPFINLEQIEDKNDIESTNQFNGFDELAQSSKEESKINKIKFVTKSNKTSFIVSKKKTQREEKSKDIPVSNGRWSKEERIQFAQCLWKFGTNWKKINNIITTRDNIQIRSHAQKFLVKLKSNEEIIKKKLKLNNLNWAKSFKILKENFNDEELLSLLTSIESELGDNNRMTQRYLERKQLLKKILDSTHECSTVVTSLEENNSIICNNNVLDLKETNENTNFVNENELEDLNMKKNCENLIDSDKNNAFLGMFSRNTENSYENDENENIDKVNILTDKYMVNYDYSNLNEKNINFYE